MLRHLKWLYPGLGIKRWMGLIILGVFFANGGAAALIFGLLGLEAEARTRAYAFAGICFLLGGVCVLVGFYRLVRSIGQLLTRRLGRNLVDIAYEQRYLAQKPKVVVFGGGTGMAILLRGLKDYTADITAVVSVADDGGSSGKLRRELDMIPPGDIRKCLIALSDEAPIVGELLKFRFDEGGLEGHSMGNLILTALTRITGEFGQAVRQANRIFATRGRVIPSTLDMITLVAVHEDGSRTVGQRKISESRARIRRVMLEPNPGRPRDEIVDAIRAADLIVLGPGSLYTSILPNLLIDGIPQAIRSSKAVRVYVANVMTHEGETRGYRLLDHLDAIRDHVGDALLDYILVNSGEIPPDVLSRPEMRDALPVRYVAGELKARDFRIVEDDVVDRGNVLCHDSLKLAEGLIRILALGR